MQVTFADLASTARSVSFAHAPAPGGAWAELGAMALRAHGGDSRLQHVIKLGARTPLQRYLRVTFSGHLSAPSSGARACACYYMTCRRYEGRKGVRACTCKCMPPAAQRACMRSSGMPWGALKVDLLAPVDATFS